MSYKSVFLLLCTLFTFTYGMDCNYNPNANFIERTFSSCPGPLDDSSKSYCCPDWGNQKVYCCDAQEFAVKTGLGVIIPAVIAISVVVMALIFCISCCCCTCCPWYKRRHRGTVYGKVRGFNTVQVVQQGPNPQMQYPQANPNTYAYPVHQTAMPPVHDQAPPQYTPEAYVKQAPYNPNYNS